MQRPADDSASISSGEKENYLRDRDCGADGIGRFVSEVWDDTKTSTENVKLFRA